jgi:uncharacterized membrane protein
MRRPGTAHLLAGFMTVAGTTHFAVPRAYEGLIPAALGSPRGWVYASGAAELCCAAGLALPKTRQTAAWATAALFVVVFPGNITMAVDTASRSVLYRAIAYGRLPFQVPLVWWAVRVATGAPRTGRTASRRPRAAASS